MKTIETNAIVTEDGQLTIAVPKAIRPGLHRVVIVIEEQPLTKPDKRVFKSAAYQVELSDPYMSLSRDQLYNR